MNKTNTMLASDGCHDVADRWDLEIIPKFKKAIVKTLKRMALSE